MEECKQQEILPLDFIYFINKNYARIEEIQKKLEQFHLDNQGCLKSNKGFYNKFNSIDSCFSDEDVAKVISATIIPKIDRFDSLGQIQIGVEDLEEYQTASFDSEDYSEIQLKFPLVSLSNNLHEKCPAPNSSFDSMLQVHGLPVCLTKRNKVEFSYRKIKYKWKPNLKSSNVKESRKNKTCVKKFRKKRPKLCDNCKLFNTSEFRSLKENTTVSQKSYSEQLSFADFQLTLPPLHSSVLTLLGQKSALKTSPRNPVSQDVPHGTTKHKKLRRHGRNKRKSDSKSKGDATKSGVVDEQQNNEIVNSANSTHENAEDEPNETQVSKMNHCPDDHSKIHNTINADSRVSSCDLLNDTSTLVHLRKPLFKILDEKLVRSKWNPDDISKTDQEIELLKNDLRKYDAKFKSASISMKEDLWLSFPRTWSRKSATFGIPTNPKILKTLEPSTYLKNYVNISEPRIHLYNLVFHRHRTIENPTGKHISFQTLKRGISEVIGRPFTDDEMSDLAFQFMGLPSMNCDVDESLFRGISAFCERIYGYHALEDGTECHECSQSTTKDKTRCHLNQKSHLEKADFEFIASKIRKNEVKPSLSKLLKAICDRD